METLRSHGARWQAAQETHPDSRQQFRATSFTTDIHSEHSSCYSPAKEKACGCRLSQEWPILGSNCQVHSREGFLVLFINMAVERQICLNFRKCVRIRLGCFGKKMKPSIASSSHKNVWGPVGQDWCGSVKNAPCVSSFLLYLPICVTSVLKVTGV